MSRVFYYELKRLIVNKVYLGLLLINCIYAWFVLTGDIVLGVAYTAPFSPWSLGAYLSMIMPAATISLLFLLGIYHSRKEKTVEPLTSATPVKPHVYTLVRMVALGICFLILCILLMGLSVYFYISIFDYRDFGVFVTPALLVILPCFVFTLGIGHMAGRIHYGLIYAIMIALLVAGFSGADFFCIKYFTNYPISLPVGVAGEPEFHVNAGFFMGRVGYFMAGVVLLAIGTTSLLQWRRKA